MRLTNSRNIQKLTASGFFNLGKSLILSVRYPLAKNLNSVNKIQKFFNLLLQQIKGLVLSYIIILVQTESSTSSKISYFSLNSTLNL